MLTRKNYFILFLVSIILTFTSFFYIASKAEVLTKYWGNDYILEIYQHQYSIDKFMIQSCLLFLCLIFGSLILFIFNIKNKLIIYSISIITLILFIGLNISLNIAPTDTNLSELGTNDITLVTDSTPAVIEPTSTAIESSSTVIESNEASVDTTSNIIPINESNNSEVESSYFVGEWRGIFNGIIFYSNGDVYIKFTDGTDDWKKWKFEKNILYIGNNIIQKIYVTELEANSFTWRLESSGVEKYLYRVIN